MSSRPVFATLLLLTLSCGPQPTPMPPPAPTGDATADPTGHQPVPGPAAEPTAPELPPLDPNNVGITVPGAFLGYRDGNVVKELIGQGESVSVSMRVDVERREGLKSASVWGTLPGTSDEQIFVLAHLDGYFEAALDNASGISVMISLAEHFAARPAEERRRSLVFLGTAGHHAGSPGSRWLHDNRETALSDAVLMINCEHVSVRQTVYWGPHMRMTDIPSPRRWWVNGSDRLTGLVLDAYRTFGVAVWDHMEDRAAGEMGSVARDLPSIQIIRSPEIKHTDQDIPAWVPEAGLEAVARAYAKIIDKVNMLDRAQLQPSRSPSTQGGRL